GAKILEGKIDELIEKNGLTGKIKIWLSGFSRAAAVANLTAADCYESGRFDGVYATQFGVPRTSKAAYFIPGIFNICGKYDPVPQIPIESWGYERYGMDLYTPAEETDIKYLEYMFQADDVVREMSDRGMWNNPEINHQLHMIIEFLAEMFPTSEEYVNEFQDTLMTVWTQANPERLFIILDQAMSQMEKLDARDAYSSEVFIDYLSYISSLHLKEEQSLSLGTRWNPDAGTVDNLMLEHMPYTYIAWLFSGLSSNELFGGAEQTRRVVIQADADIEVYWNGRVLAGMRRNGEFYNDLSDIDEKKLEEIQKMDEEELLEYLLSNIYINKNGNNTVIYLPMNADVTVLIRTYDLQNIAYFDVTFDPGRTFGTMSKLSVFLASKGVYSLDFVYDAPLTDIKTLSGHATNVQHVDLPYSTTLMMVQEAVTTDHISIKTLLRIIIIALVFALIVAVICAILAINHHRGKKKGKKDIYSSLFTIVPCLVLITEFSLLTQFFTVNMFAIGVTRALFAGLTMFMMLVMALHGLIRHRNSWNMAVSALMLVLIPVNVFAYQRSSIVSSSLRHFLIYYLFVIFFTMLAVSTFFVPKVTKPVIRKVLSCISCGMAISSAVFSELAFCLAGDDPSLRTICRTTAAVFIIIFAFLRKRAKEWGFIWIFAAVILGELADVFIGYSFITGVVLFAACHICLVIAFQRRKKLRRIQWIIWAAVSSGAIVAVLLFSGKAGTFTYGAAAYAPILVLMLVSSFNVDRMINIAAGMFFISDLMLALYQTKHLHISIHIIYMALFYAAMLLFAGLRTKLTEEKSVSVGGTNDE
ncbi:MAG: lysoplasmalogenase, partial [Lachnospiraceae bacterium]|nr:lysoplasmalogenase [Lachnospiraceae bacterium]